MKQKTKVNHRGNGATKNRLFEKTNKIENCWQDESGEERSHEAVHFWGGDGAVVGMVNFRLMSVNAQVKWTDSQKNIAHIDQLEKEEKIEWP